MSVNNDLISRSALLEDLQEYLNQEATANMTFTDMGEGIDLSMERVKEAPAVDAVEVVRCKDCLNAMKMPECVREYFGYREDALDCGMGCGVVLPDDYCSKGCEADAEVEG